MTSKPINSAVFQEFIKIAKDQGFLTTEIKKEKDVVGNASKPTPVEDHRRYEPTEEYDVTDLKCIIEQAHPEKKKEIAKAQGEGGVVENIIEQQEKDIEVATNTPSGALIGVHAKLINELVKLANECEDKGDLESAMKIDAAIERIHFPFVDSQLRKNAFPIVPILGFVASIAAPLAVDWLMGKVYKPETEVKGKGKNKVTKTKARGIGKGGWAAAAAVAAASILGMLGNRITSLREGLKTDIEDLFQLLQAHQDVPSAKSAMVKLQPFAAKMRVLDLSTPEGFQKFVKEYENFKSSVWPGVKSDILKAANIEDTSITPYGAMERAKAKMDDVDNDIEEMDETISEIKSTGKKVEYAAEKDLQETQAEQESSFNLSPGASGLQQILSQRGFINKKWETDVTGELDANTINAAKELEQYIDSVFKKANVPITDSMVGAIITANNTLNPSFDPEKLNKMLYLLEEKLQKQQG